MNEIWKSVPGYGGKYEVSTLGRVRSLLNHRGTVMAEPKRIKIRVNACGYFQVGLWKNATPKTFSVHKLVAMAFLSHVGNGAQVHHVDRNRLNNRLDNLELVTAKQNITARKWKPTPQRIFGNKKYLAADIHYGDLSSEIWKDIPEHDGLQISSCGRVLRVRNKGSESPLDNFRLRKPEILSNGYIKCTSGRIGGRGGKAIVFTIHRQVAKTFIPNPMNSPQVNHKDGNKLNNRADNLEWVTSRENNDHAVKLGLRRRGEFQWFAKLTESKVCEIRSLYGTISIVKIAKRFGVSRTCIGSIVKRKNWKHVL